jgi:site-specific DNA recombinase
MLLHQGYMGVAVCNQTTRTKAHGKQITTPRPEADHIILPEGTIPAIVTADVFAAVQARLSRNKAEATRNNQNAEAFLLRAGFIVCGYCGKPIRSVWVKDCPNQAARGYYANHAPQHPHENCPSFAMSAKKLDAAVWALVEATVMHPETIAAEVETLRRDDPTLADLATVARVLNEVARKQANLSRSIALLDDADAAAPLIAELKALGERKRELDTEQDTLLARQASWQVPQDQITSLQAWITMVATNLHTERYSDRRDWLAALGVQVKLYRKDHAPRFEIFASLPLSTAPTTSIVEQRSMW